MEKVVDAQVITLCRRFLADLNTPVSLKIDILMRHNEWDQLVQCRVDPSCYLDTVGGTERFRRDYQAVELLRKFPELPTTIDRKAVARAGFWASEAQCFKSNQRLSFYLDRTFRSAAEEGYLFPGDRRIAEFIRNVRKTVERVLGPLPPHLLGRFGPGATYESEGHRFAKRLTLGDKMQIRLTSTPDATLLSPYVYGTAWGRAVVKEFPYDSGVQNVRGNRFSTVPKDATKDRAIAIEPGINVFLQLAVGQHIRHRLLYGAALDLKHGQEKHHDLARIASITGEWATIDLSSASDTVCRTLVQLFLPDDWFSLLSTLRSPFTRMSHGADGRPFRSREKGKKSQKVDRWVTLEKFSSMGNGFTFELETLLFYAIAKAAGGLQRDELSVYGDDIIIPTRCASDVLAALRFFGFTPNQRKTFVQGPFRESCGGDFFCGVDVTPYRLTKELLMPSDWISVANGLFRWSRAGLFQRDPVKRARAHAIGQIPSEVRKCRGPVTLGDIVIHDYSWKNKVAGYPDDPILEYEPDETCNAFWLGGIRYVRTWSPVQDRVPIQRFTGDIQLALALYGSASSGLTPRNAVSGYTTKWVPFS
jgi:hypothetical protein